MINSVGPLYLSVSLCISDTHDFDVAPAIPSTSPARLNGINQIIILLPIW